MPIGIVRLWRGIDISNPVERDANPFATWVQKRRDDWLKFRLKHGIHLGTAKVASPTMRGDFSEAERLGYAVRKFLHCLSGDMKTPGDRSRAAEALQSLAISAETIRNAEIELKEAFRECRAIELESVRQNIEALCNLLPDDNKFWMPEIHKILDRFLMIEKRCGHSELFVTPVRTIVAGIIYPTKAEEPHTATGMQNPFLPNDPVEKRRGSDTALPHVVFDDRVASTTNQSPEGSDSDTSFSEELLERAKQQSAPSFKRVPDDPGEADSSSEEGSEVPQDARSSRGVAIPSSSTAAGNGTIRPARYLQEAPVAPAGQPVAKAEPTGTIWTGENEERRKLSQQLIDDLLTTSTRLEIAQNRTAKGLALSNCFEILKKLADPALAPYRSASLKEGLKSAPLLTELNKAMRALPLVIDTVPSEKRAPSGEILAEWNALVGAENGLARTVPDPGVLTKSEVASRIGAAKI